MRSARAVSGAWAARRSGRVERMRRVDRRIVVHRDSAGGFGLLDGLLAGQGRQVVTAQRLGQRQVVQRRAGRRRQTGQVGVDQARQCRRRRRIQRADLHPGQQRVVPQRLDRFGRLGGGADRDDQPGRAAQRQLIDQRGRHPVEVVSVVDDEKLLFAGEPVLGGAQQLGRSRGVADINAGQQPAERAERDDLLGRGADHPVNGRCGRLGGAAGQQRLAGPVGSEDRHAAMLRILQCGRDVTQHGLLRPGNPSTRHRRILWRGHRSACG